MLPCIGCAYRAWIPGNSHIRCHFDWRQLPEQIPVNQGSARTAQWFMFPFNYDPVWGPDDCQARSETKDQAKIAPSNPLAELLSLLR
jgi:hypothetical protein